MSKELPADNATKVDKRQADREKEHFAIVVLEDCIDGAYEHGEQEKEQVENPDCTKQDCQRKNDEPGNCYSPHDCIPQPTYARGTLLR